MQYPSYLLVLTKVGSVSFIALSKSFLILI
jgi:hypothetical protein